MKALGEVEHTARGFERIDFKDRYGSECSLQASSLAEYEEPGISAVWFGPNDPDPKELVPGQGWVKRELPEGWHTTTRAHLDREMVRALIAHLQTWLDVGSFVLGSDDGSADH